MGMIPPGLKKEIRTRFLDLVSELKKPIVVFGQPYKEDCPNCLHDHNGESINQFDSSFAAPVVIFGSTVSPISFTRGRCPVCHGRGRLESPNISNIYGLVLWNPPSVDPSKGSMVATPAGLEGKNVVRIKVEKCYYDVIRDCTKIVLDGVDCVLAIPPVLRGTGEIDDMVTAYLFPSAVGSSVRG